MKPSWMLNNIKSEDWVPCMESDIHRGTNKRNFKKTKQQQKANMEQKGNKGILKLICL